MKKEIHIFGSLVDVIGANKITLEEIQDSDVLLNVLHQKFPLLVDKKMLIAIDKKIITSKTIFHSSSEIALLPPFSGG